MGDPVRLTDGPDAAVPWHYGDPMREQRAMDAHRSPVRVDVSHRGVLTLTGPDRLELLHALTTQHVSTLEAGRGTTAYVLSPTGHIEHVLYAVDDGTTTWAHTEPGHAAELARWLDSMRFMLRVEVADLTADYAIVWAANAEADANTTAPRRAAPDSLGGAELFVPRADLDDTLGEHRAGMWAYEARRIAAGVPRVFADTDHRTIPNEISPQTSPLTLGAGVHLEKGCYRGQEAVARVHNLGRPPRRLTLLHLDGSVDRLPDVGAELIGADGRNAGRVGTSARHYELGPIALGLVRRATPMDSVLHIGDIAAAQEPIVDPEVGLHVRAARQRR